MYRRCFYRRLKLQNRRLEETTMNAKAIITLIVFCFRGALTLKSILKGVGHMTQSNKGRVRSTLVCCNLYSKGSPYL